MDKARRALLRVWGVAAVVMAMACIYADMPSVLAQADDAGATDTMGAIASSPMVEADDAGSAIGRGDEPSSASGRPVPDETPGNVTDDDVAVTTMVTENTSVHVSYASYVEGQGWQDAVRDGEMSGTSAQALRVEACRLSVTDALGTSIAGAIQYRAHVQDVGWQEWMGDDEVAGSEDSGLRIEALMVRLVGSAADAYDVYYRAHVQNLGWLSWAKDGEAAGSAAHGLRVEALQVELRAKGAVAPSNEGAGQPFAFLGNVGVSVTTHVQNVGWTEAVGDGGVAGTTGRSLALEAVKISIDNLPQTGDVIYEAHVQNIGWQGEVNDGTTAGTTGRALSIEALSLRLDGELANGYDIYYRVHVSQFGWLAWVSNGLRAGTNGMSRPIEALQATLVPKGAAAPAGEGYAGDVAFVSGATVSCGVGLGDGGRLWASDGNTAGTMGRSLSITHLQASVASFDGIDGGITYATSPDGATWYTASDGDMTPILEGVQVVRFFLTGTLSRFYDVCYRTHVGKYGWQDWARDGGVAGSSGYGLGIEALQLVLVPKFASAPGSVACPYFDTGASCIGQMSWEANAAQLRVVTAAWTTPSPGAGLCAAWVEGVVANAGYGRFYGDARDLYASYCHTSDIHGLKVGMIVAVARHSHTRLGRIYGHVGIYVGNGMLMDNVGYVRTVRLADWMAWYGDLVPVRWGWLGNRVLAT